MSAGHNHVAAEELRLLMERIERLNEERKGIGQDVTDVFREAKARGYDAKAMRQVLKLRKMEATQRASAEALRQTYKEALGL